MQQKIVFNYRFSPVAYAGIDAEKLQGFEDMKEYKILSQKDKFFSGKFDPQLLEQAINSYAEKGWEVVSMATASMSSFDRGRDEVVVLLQKDSLKSQL